MLAEKRSRRAMRLARMGRKAIEASIEELNVKIEAVKSGCVDFDLGEALIKLELRLLNLVRELERFEREVSQPAEELHRRTTSAPTSVRFSDSSADFRTNPGIEA